MTTKRKTLWVVGGVGSVLLLFGFAVGGLAIWFDGPKRKNAAVLPHPLIGDWRSYPPPKNAFTPGQAMWWFFSDGTCFWRRMGESPSPPARNASLEGKYRLIDESHLETDFDGKTTQWWFRVTGNYLEIQRIHEDVPRLIEVFVRND